jgi:tetratricopeptide (TPR) repeat protein
MTYERATATACLLLLALNTSPPAPVCGFGGVFLSTSGSPDAQPSFLCGVAALHSFEYEEANDAFKRAQRLDPGFAMAYWGEAMTYSQTLWRHEDVEAGRQTLARWRSTSGAQSRKLGTAEEEGFLQAVEMLFGDGDSATRRQAYAEGMGRLYTRFSNDPEVASFYALALLGTVSRGLIGAMDAVEGHSAGLAGSDTQARVAEILIGVLKAHPRHPGALHYLLHNYDYPQHARLAQATARTYAKVAPESSHALHMPSHIFLQLGLWHDAARSDRSAFEASDRWIKRKDLGPAMRNYHALAWLEYELLQLGRYREAWDTIGELEAVVKASGALSPGRTAGPHNPLLSDLSSMRARFVVETRRWNLMSAERNFGNVHELFAIGMSAARANNAPLAEQARQGLAGRSESEQEGDLRPVIAIMERELAALIELTAGRHDRAIDILRTAARAELDLPAPFGLPEPIKPAPELLGEVLLVAGQPREAAAAFEQALERHTNRTLSVLGLARAETALGRTDMARRHYRQVLANFDRADADLAELTEVRQALKSLAKQRGPGKVGG